MTTERPDCTSQRTLPKFSVVICTDGRASALGTALDCLIYLDYPCFEVCVVHGPTEDGTRELLAEHGSRIKVAACSQRNLSMSRNIGIALAAGDIIAFIDDDGLAEPEWLRDLEKAFDSPAVGCAGGVVYDHTGANLQYRYSSANRLGQADWARQTPADAFNFPLSFNFPYVQGTNSAFRSSTLIAIGGFDEEYEFYLDETDVCCRMVDAGFVVRQLPDARVHHKFLPSAIRNEHRVTRHRYAVIKNKLYFSLVNNRGHYGVHRVIQNAMEFFNDHERDIREHVEGGKLLPEDLDTFQVDVARAWDVGLRRGLSGKRRLLRQETLDRYRSEYLEFRRLQPHGARRTLIYISQEYPPSRIGGIGRCVHQLARGTAMLGHHVHVLTRGDGHDRVDFEEGVWVHRLLTRPIPAPLGLDVPPHIWASAATAACALNEIASKRPVTAVCAPIWDCEGIAVLVEGRFPLVTSLHTTLSSWISCNPELASNPAFMNGFGCPMLALESQMASGSAGIFANSHAIVDDIERGYGLQMDPDRIAYIPLGLDDWSAQAAVPPPALPTESVRLLFVGRLEGRKGIDILLAAAKRVLARYHHAYLDIVGNDTIPGPGGRPWRALFEDDREADSIRPRVVFHGEVTEARLRGFYQNCDILVGPSRFESFGLMLVEGMMFSKPVIGCRAGGMVEVVNDGETGLLAEPGNVESLEACLDRLIPDGGLRARLGAAGRERYERHFTSERMTAEVVTFLIRIGDAWSDATCPAAELSP